MAPTKLFALLLLTLGSIVSLRADTLVVSPRTLLFTNAVPADYDLSSPPAVGTDGTNYLVVATRLKGTPGNTTVVPTDFIATSLDSKGNILHQSVISSPLTAVSRPTLAFDGTNYLLVFVSDGQIYGRQLKTNGTVLKSNGTFVISIYLSGSNSSPSVAFDGQNFLVVWHKSDDSYPRIYGARVTRDGQVMSEFPIYAGALSQLSPDVAFNGTNFLVVWRDFFGHNIRGTRVSTGGTVLDPASIPISTAPDNQYCPNVTSDGTNWLVVWSDTRNYVSAGSSDIYATRVSGDGALLDGPADSGGFPVNTNASGFKHNPQACFDGEDFFITWELSQRDVAGIYANRISPDGTLLEAPANNLSILVEPGNCEHCAGALANPVSNGTSVLVPSVNNRVETRGSIYAKVVTPRNGLGEVFWQNTEGKAISWFLDGTDFLGAVPIAQRLPEWRLMAQPDMNGDSHKDLLWQHRDGRLTVWYMNETRFVSAAILKAPNSKWIVAGTGDINKDTAVDIIFRNANGTTAVWFMNNTNFLGASLLAGGKAAPVGWTLRAVGDIDGTPASDLLWQHADGRVAVWTLEGAALIRSTLVGQTATSWIVTGIADFNSDNENDILFQNKDGRSTVYLMNGANVLSFVDLRDGTSIGSGWRIAGPR